VNQFRLSGCLVERSAPRYTPAGVAVVEAQIRCESEVVEGGRTRALDFCISAIGLGTVAQDLERVSLGARLQLEGFVATRSRRSSRLVLHVTSCRTAQLSDTGNAQADGGTCKGQGGGMD